MAADPLGCKTARLAQPTTAPEIPSPVVRKTADETSGFSVFSETSPVFDTEYLIGALLARRVPGLTRDAANPQRKEGIPALRVRDRLRSGDPVRSGSARAQEELTKVKPVPSVTIIVNEVQPGVVGGPVGPGVPAGVLIGRTLLPPGTTPAVAQPASKVKSLGSSVPHAGPFQPRRES